MDYDNYEVIAIDDRSTDRTGEIMDRLASATSGDRGFRPIRGQAEVGGPRGAFECRLKIVHIRELPAGWMGKAHAMWAAAKQTDADWLLFTDADVMFRPDCLRRAIAYAESERADHLVVLPSIVMKRPGEKMMLAFFQLLFVFGHR